MLEKGPINCGCKPFIFAPSLSRTGTYSLKLALEQLGFGPVSHMFDHIQVRSTEWNLAVVRALRNPDAVNWQALTSVYGGGCDEPTCGVATEIIRSFADGMMPDKDGEIDALELGRLRHPGPSVTRCVAERCRRPIKVILFSRAQSAWWTSLQATVFRHGTPSSVMWRLKRYLALARPDGGRSWSFRQVLRYSRMERYHEGYMEEHIRIVRSAVADANERLGTEGNAIPMLEYQIKDGWEPLCGFLEVPVPDTPFPRVNDTASFQRELTSNALVSVGWALLWASIAVAGGASILRGVKW